MRRPEAAGLIALVAVFAVHALLTPPLEDSSRLLRVRDRVSLALGEVVPDLLAARVVFVGELHDQASHHAAQLRLIEALHESDEPVAVALEMFRDDAQAKLDRWVAGRLSLTEFLEVYHDNWSSPWSRYGAILLYARRHQIPLVGLNIKEGTVRDVARGGFASLSNAQRQELPPVSCEVDDAYEDFIRQAMGMHGHRGRTFRNFCEAQLLWDAAMAANLARFLDQEPAIRVVVLAGSGHAWKRGIPARLATLSTERCVSVIPEIPGRIEPGTITLDDADYLWQGLAMQ